MRLVANPVVHDLLSRADNHKGIRINVLYQSFEGTDLTDSDNGEEYVFLFAAESSFALNNCHTAPDIL